MTDQNLEEKIKEGQSFLDIYSPEYLMEFDEKFRRVLVMQYYGIRYSREDFVGNSLFRRWYFYLKDKLALLFKK